MASAVKEKIVTPGQLRIFNQRSSLGIIKEGIPFLVFGVGPNTNPDDEPFFWVDYLLPSGQVVESYPGDYIANNSEVIK
jgi:hypothetical protein